MAAGGRFHGWLGPVHGSASRANKRSRLRAAPHQPRHLPHPPHHLPHPHPRTRHPRTPDPLPERPPELGPHEPDEHQGLVPLGLGQGPLQGSGPVAAPPGGEVGDLDGEALLVELRLDGGLEAPLPLVAPDHEHLEPLVRVLKRGEGGLGLVPVLLRPGVHAPGHGLGPLPIQAVAPGVGQDLPGPRGQLTRWGPTLRASWAPMGHRENPFRQIVPMLCRGGHHPASEGADLPRAYRGNRVVRPENTRPFMGTGTPPLGRDPLRKPTRWAFEGTFLRHAQFPSHGPKTRKGRADLPRLTASFQTTYYG